MPTEFEMQIRSRSLTVIARFFAALAGASYALAGAVAPTADPTPMAAAIVALVGGAAAAIDMLRRGGARTYGAAG